MKILQTLEFNNKLILITIVILFSFFTDKIFLLINI